MSISDGREKLLSHKLCRQVIDRLQSWALIAGMSGNREPRRDLRGNSVTDVSASECRQETCGKMLQESETEKKKPEADCFSGL